ncbi:MAG TPA: CoA-acylating methylmalonate-semialdehyde dehydrogenase [Nocardiopsis listeri]|uniref:CoA-acylating methylmalonate-semialdehyde dehydrogenase n=1 Tax=Nocardiopsis listeri TaxID=53440 RepID=UPI001DC1CA80|nr:CoA-acylating methylmalonate-semialdehyde dehydrogenase [Nocardiopsis listeri]HJE61833.1 CoA-acylating methylmalonate-semialdehyde dehydrogenase [Nocardiopsis listeri]
MTPTTPRQVSNWIEGRPIRPEGTTSHPVLDPATAKVIANVDFAGPELVEQAIGSADQAAAAWRTTSLAKRTQVLFAFREQLRTRTDELARLITEEHGKLLSDAAGEIARGMEVVEFACGIPHLLKGGYSEGVSRGIDVHSVRQPLGTVAIISPFNFPVMVPLWFAPVAIAAGNSVVLKPSEQDPSAADLMARMWREAGLPDGVFTVLHGGPEVVNTLITHPVIKAVSFVGSTRIAQHVYETGTAHGKRVQALGGAKNHMLVLPDADLDQAADAAIGAAYGSAGERCMAISALLAVDSVADALVERINERIGDLRTGDGRREVDMGPLVSASHRDRVLSYIESGQQDGATVVADGRRVVPDGSRDGYWVGPTLLDHVTPDMSVYTDEIFGPVLSVVRVPSYEEGVRLINEHPYGNGTAIFTRDGGAARRFEYEVEVGMVGVNVPIPVPVSYYSFGGWKSSLFGDSHAHGTEGVHFYTRGKVVTTRWPDPTSRGIELGFPVNT